MIDVALIFKAGTVALSVAKYTGLVEDRMHLKLEQLASSELDAGIRALQQAASSNTEQTTLLREARARFNKAIGLEKEFRLAAAHLGLALCHAQLGDSLNAKNAMADIGQIAPPEPTTTRLFIDSALQGFSGSTKGKKDVFDWTMGDFVADVIVDYLGVAKADKVAKLSRLGYEQTVNDFLALQKEADDVVKRSAIEGVDKVFGRFVPHPVKTRK